MSDQERIPIDQLATLLATASGPVEVDPEPVIGRDGGVNVPQAIQPRELPQA